MSPALTGRLLSTVPPERSYIILFLFHFCGPTYLCARAFHDIVYVLSHSVTSDFVTPQTVACQAPLAMGFLCLLSIFLYFPRFISPCLFCLLSSDLSSFSLIFYSALSNLLFCLATGLLILAIVFVSSSISTWLVLVFNSLR